MTQSSWDMGWVSRHGFGETNEEVMEDILSELTALVGKLF
jgi:hypothetical protein